MKFKQLNQSHRLYLPHQSHRRYSPHRLYQQNLLIDSIAVSLPSGREHRLTKVSRLKGWR